MTSPKKYVPIIAAFLVGITGAAGYAVHAQSVTSTSTSSITPTPTVSGQPADGETADDTATVQTGVQDPKQLDGETADNNSTAGAAVQESENGATDTGSDTGEVDTN